MYKRITLTIIALCAGLSLLAQEYTGGVKGTVVSRADRSPVGGAVVTVSQGTTEIAELHTDGDGNFHLGNLADGMYDMVITADEYKTSKVNFTVDAGYVKNMFSLSLSPEQKTNEVDDTSFSEFDMDDSGYSDSPTILFSQNDVFNNVASYDFSSVRFRVRGYASESQDVYLAGVRMNDAITGYTPYSLWSGLNEAVRTKDVVNGSEPSDYGFGGYNGLTNIFGDAANVRKGWRGSVLTNSALYRLRLMMTYSSGQLDNGWSYAFSGSVRLGGNDWIKGVYYRSFGYYGSVEKEFNSAHKLGFTFMAAPGSRGTQNASTQEVYDLMGDNMYNSNWGYQDGKMRNSRVRVTHEPIAILKYDFAPSMKVNGSVTALYRFGKNGYRALDWYDAPDPRPDYYRNLPSYFYMDNSDYNRTNMFKYAWTKEAWEQDVDNITHLDWDRLYTVNRSNATEFGNRSKYAQEERHVDQQDFNLAAKVKWNVTSFLTVRGGVNGKINRTENYKKMHDLLGGDYYVNIDQFAERDFAFSQEMIQNDLDYYEAHGQAQRIKKGDKYGYDYYAHIAKANAWVSGDFRFKGLQAVVSGTIGYEQFYREGLMRKGLFPGLKADGSYYQYNGKIIGYDYYSDKLITSKGKSEKQDFLTYGAKLNLNYTIPGGHRVYANVGYMSEAPAFNQAFISPRTRNSIVPDLQNHKTFTADLNYQYSNNGYDVRVTGFYTTIKDQSDVMSFYDDSQNTFTNFAMSGIDERHVGLELGFKVPVPMVRDLSLKGVLSYGSYVYTSNPKMYQSYDNSAEVIADTWGVEIPYWKSNPTYKTDKDGNLVFDKDQKHHIASTPELAASLGLSWNRNYWFIDMSVNYFANSYLDMNPLYRTDMATAGPDRIVEPREIEYMASQEKFDPVFLLNASVGKSWYIHRKYQIGFSLSAKNILNNKDVKTGGYEQTRLVENTKSKTQYYKFDPKYFYMSGFNYMLNIYFRF